MSANDTHMNCDEYQQAVGADPSFDGGVEHVDQCAACQAYRDEMRSLDTRIRRALALKVPDFVLPELGSLSGGNIVPLQKQRRVRTPAWFALAATVVLAVFIGLRLAGNADISPDELAAEVLSHVMHEPDALRVSNVAVDDRHLDDVVPARIAKMNHSAGMITYAETCPINGNKIPHLVIQGRTGPVTILLLPQEKISGAIELEDEYRRGVILPVGDGSVAIIGTKEESLEQIQEQVLNSVQWST